jgi:hypothetical protein
MVELENQRIAFPTVDASCIREKPQNHRVIASIRRNSKYPGFSAEFCLLRLAVVARSSGGCEVLMAVRAHHFALGDFSEHSVHRHTEADKVRDVGCLGTRVCVIEFQHHRIGFPATNARMEPQVVKHSSGVTTAMKWIITAVPLDVCFAVGTVVFF